MGGIGGSIESITLAGRIFSVTADTKTIIQLGGFQNTVESNSDGTVRIIKIRVPMSLSGIVVQIDSLRGDNEYLQGLSNSTDFFPISLILPSGEIRQGVAQLIGELSENVDTATMTINLMGPGTLTSQ